MQHKAAFHQGLHCLLRFDQPTGTEKHHNSENSTCDPLNYTMGSLIIIASKNLLENPSEYEGLSMELAVKDQQFIVH